MKTLLLDTVTWDLVLDTSGNIALASEPYSQAQDAASAIRTFRGEVYYNTKIGVPYWPSILGHWPPLTLMKAQFTAAAHTVPGVLTARCFVATWSDREVTGQVQITTGNGMSSATQFLFGAPPIPV